MNDKQLLELAAKAAGIPLVYIKAAVDGWYGDNAWNPLADDGDALRLAVAIGPLEFSISEYGTAVRKPEGQWYGCEAHLFGGKQASTRRAIVRAAAAIARATTQEQT